MVEQRITAKVSLIEEILCKLKKFELSRMSHEVLWCLWLGLLLAIIVLLFVQRLLLNEYLLVIAWSFIRINNVDFFLSHVCVFVTIFAT